MLISSVSGASIKFFNIVSLGLILNPIASSFSPLENKYEILHLTSPCLTTGDSSSFTIKLSKPTDFKSKAG